MICSFHFICGWLCLSRSVRRLREASGWSWASCGSSFSSCREILAGKHKPSVKRLDRNQQIDCLHGTRDLAAEVDQSIPGITSQCYQREGQDHVMSLTGEFRKISDEITLRISWAGLRSGEPPLSRSILDKLSPRLQRQLRTIPRQRSRSRTIRSRCRHHNLTRRGASVHHDWLRATAIMLNGDRHSEACHGRATPNGPSWLRLDLSYCPEKGAKDQGC